MIEFLLVVVELCLTMLLLRLVARSRTSSEPMHLGLFAFKLTKNEPNPARMGLRNRA